MFRPSPVEQEPKRKNRFWLEFPTELGIQSYNVQTSGKPKVTISAVEMPYQNTSQFVSGRYKFETIDIEFIDVVGPSTTQILYDYLQIGTEFSTGIMNYSIGMKKNFVLKALDPAGVEVETWTLIGCIITSADFDSFDYGSDDVTKIKITVQPDRCLLS